MKRIFKRLSVLSLAIALCSPLIASNIRPAFAENKIVLRAISGKTGSKNYEGNVTKEVVKLTYSIKVVYSMSYNANTYKVSTYTQPRIVVNGLAASGLYGSVNDAYMQNISLSAKKSSDNMSVDYSWSFDLYVKIQTHKIKMKHISGSATLAS